MISIEELVQELKNLTPEQLQQVAQIVHGLSLHGEQPGGFQARTEIPQWIIEEAVLHGWPQDLFTKLIGSLPEIERSPQPAYEVRKDL